MIRTTKFSTAILLILSSSFLSVLTPNLKAQPETTLAAADAKDKANASAEKAAQSVLKDLKLTPANETKVHEILVAHFATLKAWRETNDAHIKTLWDEFNQARSKQDQAKADEALAQIDGVYATIHSEHEQFLAKLAAAAPDQVDKFKDILTVNKVKVTYDTYHEIFHGLKPEQEAFLLKNLQAARDEAIDAASMKEKSAFFKKYKIKIEAYLTAQGYDVKKSYVEFVAKQKAEKDGKTAKAAGKKEDE